MCKALLLLAPLLLALCAPAAGQTDAAAARSRVALTAYTGFRVPYNTGFVSVSDADGQPLYDVTERRGGGVVLGADAEIRLAGPLSLLAGGTYGPAGISSYFVGREAGYRDTADFRVRYTGETWLARAALSLRVQHPPHVGDSRPRPATDLFAGAGMVRQFDSNHPAANFGVRGAFPLPRPGLEVVFGLEDYLVLWDDEALTPQLADVLRPGADPVAAELLYDTSNVLLLRAGLSLRF